MVAMTSILRAVLMYLRGAVKAVPDSCSAYNPYGATWKIAQPHFNRASEPRQPRAHSNAVVRHPGIVLSFGQRSRESLRLQVVACKETHVCTHRVITHKSTCQAPQIPYQILTDTPSLVELRPTSLSSLEQALQSSHEVFDVRDLTRRVTGSRQCHSQ